MIFNKISQHNQLRAREKIRILTVNEALLASTAPNSNARSRANTNKVASLQLASRPDAHVHVHPCLLPRLFPLMRGSD